MGDLSSNVREPQLSQTNLLVSFPIAQRLPVPSTLPAYVADPLLLASRYRDVRALTLALTQSLSAEDQCIQSMPDASPSKWHMAHTTWFFEVVVLRAHVQDYRPFDPRYFHLFNSYYESLGSRHPRPQRGMLSRPSLEEVLRYRAHVDAAMLALLEGDQSTGAGWVPLVELGLNHEQQHQELLLTDIKHAFSLNPLLPAWGKAPQVAAVLPVGGSWQGYQGGEVLVGHGAGGFAFDNETPRHRIYLQPYALARQLVSNGDYLAFIEDGGYRRPELWLSEGWATVQAQGWRAPAYWLEQEGLRTQFTLYGERALDLAEPVCHLSFYEAAAYAAWAGARLPTEFEWEVAAASQATGAPPAGMSLASLDPHPRAAGEGEGLQQLFGAVWQWTRSSYDPYPRFQPLAGAVGEYNGKFMVGQLVLRGGSCATPAGHSRASYRNFFPPTARWQFSGLRLARDL